MYKYIVYNEKNDTFINKEGLETPYLSECNFFETLKEIKKTKFKILSLKKIDDIDFLYQKAISEIISLKEKINIHIMGFIFKAKKPYSTTKEIFNSIIEYKDYGLREEIHSLQVITTCDKGGFLLLQKNSRNNILFNIGDDGIAKYCILNDTQKVPTYYSLLCVLSGSYKIMRSDCAKSYSDEGEEISGNNIYIYKSGRSFIFIKKLWMKY